MGKEDPLRSAHSISIAATRLTLAILGVLLSACAPVTATPEAVLLNIYAAPEAAPWLSEAFVCAGRQGITLSVTPNQENADLTIRVGEPPGLNMPSFQIDSEDILIVTNRESPVQNLTLEQARDLFSGRGDPMVEVWVYGSGDDIQRAFESLVMQGVSVTSLARLAATPQQMSDTLNAEANAVGILPRHWMAGTVREVFTAGTMPVLAISSSEPAGALASLIGCLQK